MLHLQDGCIGNDKINIFMLYGPYIWSSFCYMLNMSQTQGELAHLLYICLLLLAHMHPLQKNKA